MGCGCRKASGLIFLFFDKSDLECFDRSEHNSFMSSLSSSSREKHPKRGAVPNFGRSAATGQFVLKPVSAKGGKITQRQANSAVKTVSTEKK